VICFSRYLPTESGAHGAAGVAVPLLRVIFSIHAGMNGRGGSGPYIAGNLRGGGADQAQAFRFEQQVLH
jgi:hypothetical protein